MGAEYFKDTSQIYLFGISWVTLQNTAFGIFGSAALAAVSAGIIYGVDKEAYLNKSEQYLIHVCTKSKTAFVQLTEANKILENGILSKNEKATFTGVSTIVSFIETQQEAIQPASMQFLFKRSQVASYNALLCRCHEVTQGLIQLSNKLQVKYGHWEINDAVKNAAQSSTGLDSPLLDEARSCSEEDLRLTINQISWQLNNVIQYTTLAIHQLFYLQKKEDKLQSIFQMMDDQAQYYQKTLEVQAPTVDKKTIAEHQIKVVQQVSNIEGILCDSHSPAITMMTQNPYAYVNTLTDVLKNMRACRYEVSVLYASDKKLVFDINTIVDDLGMLIEQLHMKEVLPNATLIAFTGTPLIAKAKKNTYKTFGEPIHNYTMKRAIEDGITVPLVYEGRKVKQEEPSLTINNYFGSLTEDLPQELKDKLSDKFSRFKAISEARSRINLIGFDIADHFKSYCIPKGLKAMVVCSSRAAAVEMYEVLKGVSGINPRVVITFGDKREGDDDESTDDAIKKIKAYHQKMVKPLFGDNDEKYDDHVCGDFKNPEGEINILIVKDKLLTGFDAPVAGVLYLDKSIQQHSLLQAIARVNRVYKGKDFGLIVDYWGVFGKLNKAIDMYEDAESGMNDFDKADIDGAIFGPVDEKNKLAEAYANLIAMFDAVKDSSSSDDWQKSLADEKRRKEFYNRLKEFANLLNLALSNRDIFVEVGFELIEKYRKEYLFYRKLKDSVMMRYDDEVDLSKYEQGIKNLIDTFVNATDITTVVKPVSIGDEKAMKKLLEHMDSNESRADAIKTRIESKLKQIRYDDPLLFEEFSSKIKKTIDLYNETRDADAYLESMKIMADDFRNGITSQDYPSQIASDSDSKAFYGAILTQLKKNAAIQITSDTEELIAQYSFKIKEVISDNAKRDWKHNEVVHKAMHRSLDDCLFDMFEEMGVVIDKSNIDMLDLIIDETMKVAVARY